MIRGLVWAQYYFASDWFKNIEDDDGSRCLEDDSKRQHRAARVQYLGMILAAESDHLRYDRVTRQFSETPRSNLWRLTNWRLTNWRLTNWRLTNWRLTNWRLTNWRLTNWRLTNWNLHRSEATT
jgi:hypothetical protein